MHSPHHHIPDRGSDDPRQAGASRQPRIAVVGASLTGPAVALLLAQAGFRRVAVYEAMPAGAPRGGGLLSLEHPSLDILDQLGIPRAEYVHTRSETICRAPVRRRIIAEPTRYGYPGRFTTWTQLHQALLTRLPAGIVRYRARVAALTAQNRRPLLHFADQRTAPADLVIFADGRASTGRSVLAPHRQLRYAGYVGHRGAVGYNPTNLVGFWRLEPCPGVQFVIAPVPGGVDWTFYLNTTAAQYTGMFGAAPHQRLFAHPHHIGPAAHRHVDGAAAWHLPEPLAAAIHATTARTAFPVMDIDPPEQMVWPIGDGHAVLLGDALAPVRAHTGRGANNGLEQAYGLVSALRQHHRHGANLGTALTGWQRRHLPIAVAAVHLGPIIGAKLGLGTTTTTAPRNAMTLHQHPWVRQAAATNGR